MKKEVVAMLLAGGQGSRLYVLTGKVAKPAIPFPLSNCVNSGIDTVGVLTQYQPLELNSYIGSGQPWDLDQSEGGVHILPPYVAQGDQGTWYKGTANAIYQNIGFIDLYDPEYVLILSGDHIYKMDYAKMVDRHKRSGAACTISVMEVPWDEAPRFGIMNVDGEDNVVEFEEKPRNPKSNLASMGIYCFSWKELRKYLVEDEGDPVSQNDFGKNIIPNMLADGKKMVAYRFAGYWKDVGTLDSLWDANMDMLAREGGLDVFDNEWPIYARAPRKAPAFLGQNAMVSHSVITQGSTIEGTVENSVVAHSVAVGAGAAVRYSVVMPGAVIAPGAVVEYAIVGEGAHIGAGAKVGAGPETAKDPDQWGIAVVGPFCCIADGETVAPNKMLDRNHEEVLRK